MSTTWHLDSWRDREIRQVPNYADAAQLADVEATLRALPPLVFAGEPAPGSPRARARAHAAFQPPGPVSRVRLMPSQMTPVYTHADTSAQDMRAADREAMSQTSP